MVAAHDLAAGEVIDSSDLHVVEMGRTGGLRAIQPSQQDLIMGRVVCGPIPEGTVLNTDLFPRGAGAGDPGWIRGCRRAPLRSRAAPTSKLAAEWAQPAGSYEGHLGGSRRGDSRHGVGSGTVWSVERVGSGSTSSKLWVSVLVPADAQSRSRASRCGWPPEAVARGGWRMIVTLGSVRGSPGVTSWCLLLAAAWPEALGSERVVLEADVDGGVLAIRN